ncbi:DNA-binding FrmR family transcriptional regulator [Nocardioides salarius]|jgi:DNA-binding FrmR family transcriptional regulator|uniref:DNA-binding FrmR family transcriptional regulator n=1 Tax=Nocardioides salarius TaxID=374513 RepID=A0ABS2MEK2_9ACTN|nr:metal-sensitive transcriptional regulator [Nocardioides salarius]MBM7509621.1 DNA-binding FrmR family transcriptional regulator [Nocardioides salarius]
MAATSVARSSLILRLKRVEGQVRGIARMVNDDRDCIDILTQLSAADQGLRSVAVGLLDEHVAQCLVAAGDASESHRATKLREAHDAIVRLARH